MSDHAWLYAREVVRIGRAEANEGTKLGERGVALLDGEDDLDVVTEPASFFNLPGGTKDAKVIRGPLLVEGLIPEEDCSVPDGVIP